MPLELHIISMSANYRSTLWVIWSPLRTIRIHFLLPTRASLLTGEEQLIKSTLPWSCCVPERIMKKWLTACNSMWITGAMENIKKKTPTNKLPLSLWQTLLNYRSSTCLWPSRLKILPLLILPLILRHLVIDFSIMAERLLADGRPISPVLVVISSLENQFFYPFWMVVSPLRNGEDNSIRRIIWAFLISMVL